VLLPLVILMFVVGILPNLVLQPTSTTVNDLLARAEERRVVLVDESSPYAWLDGAR
jgi:NADH:ubiquinone oxidoreductase subunit 4 (subunit M)